MKPVLYVQRSAQSSKLEFDFCYSAMLGAEQMMHKMKTFTHHSEVPNKPNHILVGSVEQCAGWLLENNYEVPQAIDIQHFFPFLKRNISIHHSDDITELLKNGDIFVKPYKQVKAFTGFQISSKFDFDVFSEGYKGELLVQGVLDIDSEYRVYINNDKIIGCKHYSGDCLKFPKGHFIQQIFEKAKKDLNYHSYTIDIAVLEDGTSALIELNDGWAIGNYGIEPLSYYLFCRDRWLQITGLRK